MFWQIGHVVNITFSVMCFLVKRFKLVKYPFIMNARWENYRAEKDIPLNINRLYLIVKITVGYFTFIFNYIL